MSAGTESQNSSHLRLPPSPKCGGVLCLGMHGGEDLEKLVFLDLASPLVKRRVSEENVNSGLPIGEGVYASASAHFLQ